GRTRARPLVGARRRRARARWPVRAPAHPRMRRSPVRPLVLSLAVAGALAAPAAHAQSSLGGYALDQLDPAPAGDDFFAVRSAAVAGHLEPRAHVMLDVALEPLEVAGGDAVVSEQVFVHAAASLALFDRLLLSLDLPVAVAQGGDDPTVAGVRITSP